MFQGKPIANMLFKILSTDVVGQGLYFAADSMYFPENQTSWRRSMDSWARVTVLVFLVAKFIRQI